MGEDQDGRVRGRGVARAAQDDTLGGPLHGEAAGDARKNAIAARVAPEDEVAIGYVCVGVVLIVAHLGIAPKLPAPFGDGALLFGSPPLAHLRTPRRSLRQ